MYADDTILFGTLFISEIHAIQQILAKYEEQLGQKVNLAKSQFIHHQHWKIAFQVLHVPCISKFPTYLGMPLVLGRASLDTFVSLIQRIQ